MAARKKSNTEAKSTSDHSGKNLPKRLYRSETNRVIAGVAGGLGEYFSFDPILIRLVFILLTIFGGSGVLLYIVLWVIIPSQSQTEMLSEETIRRNMHEMRDTAHRFRASFRNGSNPNVAERRRWAGIIIILLGIFFLFNSLGYYNFDFSRFWPIWLIAGGVLLIAFR